MPNKNKTYLDLASKLSPEQYGFGSWLKDNAVPLLQTGAGAALTATGVGAPIGAGLMIQGGSQIAGDTVQRTTGDETAAALTATGANIAGQMHGAGMFKGQPQMANGGDLTHYNNGGTHEQNPHGGIPIGNNASVEQGETRWEDYIFSDRVKVPGKKFTFSDASKKIEAKYNKRKNDKYDEKAKKREMEALMVMQENERERMGLKHEQDMMAKFGGCIKKADGGFVDPVDPVDPPQTDTTSTINSNQNIVPTKLPGVQYAENMGAATSLGATKNTKKLVPGEVDPELYPDLAAWKNVEYENNSPIKPDNIVKKHSQMTKDLQMYQKQFAEQLGLPTYDKVAALELARQAYPGFDKFEGSQKRQIISDYVGLPNPSQMDPNMSLTPEQISTLDPEALENYYNALEWKQAYRRKTGFEPKQYYGDIEAKEKGYNLDTPLRDLGLGIRMLTDNPTQTLKQKGILANGGKIPYSKGGKYDNRINKDFEKTFGNNTVDAFGNPIVENNNLDFKINNLELLPEEDTSSLQVDKTDYYNPNDLANKLAIPQSGEFQGIKEGDYTTGDPVINQRQQSGWGEKAAILGAQNIGNVANLALGMQGHENVDFGNARTPNYSLDIAKANVMQSYDQAAKMAAENIRRNSTSSGQSLSNMIAANTSLTKQKAAQLAGLSEQEANTRAQLQAQTDQQNFQRRGMEEQINAQGQGIAQQAIAAGLSGIGSNIAQFHRDNKAQQAQDRMMNAISSGNYVVDPNTGQLVFKGNIG